MASITLTGSLLDPDGFFSIGDQVRFTHKSNTGSTIKSAVSVITIPPSGNYNITLQYGLVRVEYKDILTGVYKDVGVVTVNQDNPATTLPELLNAAVPPSSQEMIEFQNILADCVQQANKAEQAVTDIEALTGQQTTTELINSTTIYDADKVLETSGFNAAGDGGAGKWKQNGVTGQTPSQTPVQLGGTILNDANGNQWGLVTGITQEFNGVLFYPSPFGDEGEGLYAYLYSGWEKLNDSFRTFPNIAALRSAEIISNGEVVLMEQRYDLAPTQTALYKWDESSSAANNFGTVISSFTQTAGRWIKVNNDYFTPTTSVGLLQQKLKDGINDKWSNKSIALIGDSISWGSNSPDVFNDSYAGVLRKLILADKGSTNIGFVSLRAEVTNTGGTYNDFHTVTKSGTWLQLVGDDAETMVSGYAYYSQDAGAYLDVTCPSASKFMRVFYRRNTSGGVFKVSMDGGVNWGADIDTSGSEDGSAITPFYTMIDNGIGKSEIRIQVVSGQVSLSGIQYIDSISDFSFNNFSDPGRKGIYVDDSVIDAVTRSTAVVWALGVNDNGSTEAEKNVFRAKLDRLRTKVAENKTKLYVVDFMWGRTPENWVREELAKVCNSTDNALYIALPDLLTSSGFPITPTVLSGTYGFLDSDNVHPTSFGHKIIAETMAQAMGLFNTSKIEVENNQKRWMPLELKNGWENQYSSIGLVSAYRINSGQLQVKISLNRENAINNVFSSLDLVGKLVSVESQGVLSRSNGTDQFVYKIDIGSTPDLSLYQGQLPSDVYSGSYCAAIGF